MQSTLVWDGKMGFTARGVSNHEIIVDVPVESGGSDAGTRPMELLLHGLGGCSGADVVSIIQKMQLGLEAMTIEIQGERAAEHPKRFTAIHMIFRVSGSQLNSERVSHAIELSLTKYCSVAASLNAEITYELQIEDRI